MRIIDKYFAAFQLNSVVCSVEEACGLRPFGAIPALANFAQNSEIEWL